MAEVADGGGGVDDDHVDDDAPDVDDDAPDASGERADVMANAAGPTKKKNRLKSCSSNKKRGSFSTLPTK